MALNNSRNQPSHTETMSDQHPCAKLGKEGESNFKTKDRLGDNEWCKPDDLLASAVLSHSHT